MMRGCWVFFFNGYNSWGWGALGCWAGEVREKSFTLSRQITYHNVYRGLITQKQQHPVSPMCYHKSFFCLHPLPPLCFCYPNRWLPSLFLFSHSNPEEIKNLDGSWVVTVTVLSDLYPPLALHPSVLLLFSQPVFTSPLSSALHLCLSVSATSPVYCPSSPEPLSNKLYICLFLSPFSLH